MSDGRVAIPTDDRSSGDVLVQVRDLETHFPVRRGVFRRSVGAVRAVDGVSFDVRAGETLGVVGESGSGKSTTARTLLRLVDATRGSVRVLGREITTMSGVELRALRRDVQMIFQDPYASLNPRHTIERSVREPLDIHGIGEPGARTARVHALLERVGLGADLADRYPHQLSGGQRQRVGIARALATEPRLIVADEPISALDVSIQAQIVNLLDDLKEELGLTYVFIAHDLSMVRHVSDRVAVMYLGRIVEIGPADRVFESPAHPYTRALVAAIPVADPVEMARREHVPLTGDVPDPANAPPGCSFHPRCPFATELCRTESPRLAAVGAGASASAHADTDAGEHRVACHHADELRSTTAAFPNTPEVTP